MSIIKYKAKKSKSGYLYKVRIYRVIDGKRQMAPDMRLQSVRFWHRPVCVTARAVQMGRATRNDRY